VVGVVSATCLLEKEGKLLLVLKSKKFSAPSAKAIIIGKGG